MINKLRVKGRNHPIVAFLAIANVSTLGLGAVAFSPILGDFPAFRTICEYGAKFGASAGACLAALILWGRPGLAALLAPVARWRVAPRWYALAIAGPVALVAAGLAITAATGDSMVRANPAPWLLLGAFVTPIFLGGGLGEEIGWRAYMLPLLQCRLGPLRASLAIGLCWGLWHAPAFMFEGTGKSGGITGLVVFTILCTVLSVIFTWVFNASGGSLAITILLHGCFNGSLDAADLLFPGAEPDLYVAVALLVMAVVLALGTRLGAPAGRNYQNCTV